MGKEGDSGAEINAPALIWEGRRKVNKLQALDYISKRGACSFPVRERAQCGRKRCRSVGERRNHDDLQ